MKRKDKRFVSLLALLLCVCLCGCKSDDYEAALAKQESGDYPAAAEQFLALDDYRDSAEQAEICLAQVEAQQAYDEAAAVLAGKNEALDAAVKEAEALVLSEAGAWDETLRADLSDALETAEAARIEAPACPDDPEGIAAAVKVMESADYTGFLEELAEKRAALEQSMAVYARVDQPEEAYVIECLGRVDGILEIAAVTPGNDPNGMLNKPGGYTAAVLFMVQHINQDAVPGRTLLQKGTLAGGQVEVYATAEDAAARDAYISSFEQSGVTTGSHTVVGTCVIRTSAYLNDKEQEALTAAITEELIKGA